MQRSWSLLSALAALPMIFSIFIGSSKAEEQYTLATATPGGTYYPIGVAISTLVKFELFPGEGIDLVAIPTAGSGENIGLLREDESQFAIISGLAAYQAAEGLGKFEEEGPFGDFRAIGSLWRSTDHFILRSEFAASGTLDDLSNAVGQLASFGKEGSGTILKNGLLLERLGLPIDDFELIHEGYKGSVGLFADGSVSVMNLSAGVPVSAVSDTLSEAGSDAVLLEVTDEQLARLDAGTGLWSREMIPAGTYPGQTEDVASVATPNILAVRSDVPDDVVYRLTKTIFDNLDKLQSLHSAATQIEADQAAVGLPVPMHPGAERYFQERGLALPVVSDSGFGDSFLARYRTHAEARETVNRGRVGIVTGPSTQTSARAIGDIALAVESDGLRLITMTGKGSGQNVTDLLYLGGVDAAVVQMDYLQYAKQYAYPDLEERLRILTPLFDQEVHVLVKHGIYDFGQLAGKKVNFGVRGSGAELTSEIIFRQQDVDVERTFHGDYEALELVKSGDIAAAVFVSGKPMPLLEGVALSDGLRLLAVPEVDYKGSYTASSFDRNDYSWLIDRGEIETIAVRTAIAAYNWKPGTTRFDGVQQLAERLFENVDELRSVGRHPKLRDLDPRADFGGWPRLPLVDDYLYRLDLAQGRASTDAVN
ncbi:MAG: TAXI family TRAP transporter solute-binding subunit [Geminicoccaceae bacterium]